jgi:hypothetical protein
VSQSVASGEEMTTECDTSGGVLVRERRLTTMTDVHFRHDPSIPSSLPSGGGPIVGTHTGDVVWLATMKADALLGRISDEQRVQLGATFDWEVSDDDVRVARTALSPQRVDALVQRRADTRPAATIAPDWDASADLLAL